MFNKFSILYLGPMSGTCLDRANALRRLGHSVDHLNPRKFLPASSWIDRIIWHLGGHWFSSLISKKLSKLLKRKYDICYVDGGELITPNVISTIRSFAKNIINYNIDDPLGLRDGARFKAYRMSLPFYDLVVVVRAQNVSEAMDLGAQNVMRVYMSADEISHAPRALSDEDIASWKSDVLFLGTWFPERGPFLVRLIELGVPLSIRGARWDKAPEWPILKPYWRGPAIYGLDYARALQSARVNIGMLSKANRDLHTTRSLEIPALGGLLCAERTTEHCSMYEEGKEALFWSTAEECASACRFALADEARRLKIAESGCQKVKLNGHYNEPTLSSILETLSNIK